MLQHIFIYAFIFLFLVFSLLSLFSSIAYFRRPIDIEGAKSGLKKSIPLLLLAVVSVALALLFSDPTNWLSSVSMFICGSAFIVILIAIQYRLISINQTTVSKKYEDFNNNDKTKK